MRTTGPVLPALTADQMREIDRIMIDELHIDLIQMMENAGRSLADLAQRRYAPADAVVLAGPGGNGGGGLVAARHLANRGI
ncbi:MAG: NAD(P)H-hydrate epimerase, partial [bacterium]